MVDSAINWCGRQSGLWVDHICSEIHNPLKAGFQSTMKAQSRFAATKDNVAVCSLCHESARANDLEQNERRGDPLSLSARPRQPVHQCCKASGTISLKLLFSVANAIDRFVDRDALEYFHARVEFAGFEQPDTSLALRDLCRGLRSFAELQSAAKDFVPLLEQKVDSKLLREIAPVSVRLQNGRQTKIHYERGRPPWVASRLQDFFGMRHTPRVGADRIPLVVHLLAPNQRAVQTTTDLAASWERLYPQVRRELMRRYPRHSWPESP
jgi:ATP-dependent helicase-like protein